MRIAITGVTGFIGGHLATHALGAGHQVTGFSRRPWSGPPFIPLDDRHFLDLPSRLNPSQLAGVDALVHLAVAPEISSPAVVDAVNRLGSEWLLEAANTAGVARFIFASSQSAHDDAASPYGQSKYAVEQHLQSAATGVAVRLGLVYGDSDDGLMGRATRLAARLRMFPVIGGSAARAQLIHVDQLCDAMFALAVMENPPHLVELGDPEVRDLAGLVKRQAKARFGTTPLAIPVPIGLARFGVRMASRLRLPSPITEQNLDGIQGFRPMDTRDAMTSLGLFDRNATTAARTTRPIEPVEPCRVILVGAGRIGLVHALTAAHHQDMRLVGVVDLDRRAMGRLTSLAAPGLTAFTDLDEAIRVLHPDAAIVGTPPASHVPLARRLLAAGIDVLVEKPLAASEEDRAALATAIAVHPYRYLSTGYLAGLLPHLLAIAPDLQSGRFGTPHSFDAYAFVTRVTAGVAEQRGMWELDPTISGGGALVNLGVHVLAMLDILLGPIDVDRAVLVAGGGRSSEDGASLRMTAGHVPGRFSTAWHLPGFDMPENHVSIDTDKGRMLCTTSSAAFLRNGEFELVHQVDADEGFDLAPLDAGGAFWAEQHLLARRQPGANSFELAARIEGLITKVYATADRVVSPPTTGHRRRAQYGGGESFQVMPDLRGAPTTIKGSWTAPALMGTSATWRDPSDGTIVVVPDAPGHFRTLTNEGPMALVRALGPAHLGAAAFGLSPLAAASTAQRPWQALLVLLRAELRRLPRVYRGGLVVDAYLVDLATATGNVAVIAAALEDMRARCPKARVGIEANATARLVPAVPMISEQLDLVVALGTPSVRSLEPLREVLPSSTELVVKTGVLPPEVLELAWKEPRRWTDGPGRLVVHWPGAPGLRAPRDEMIAEAKDAAGFNRL